jgi:Protein of unknown function (DUF4085)
MKYFTSDWCSGQLSDVEYERASEAYQQHYAALEASLPEAVRQISALPLHDAFIERAIFDRRSRLLILEFLGGDLQVGYSSIVLTYFEAHFDATALAVIVRDAETEFLYDEIDSFRDGFYQHSIIFWPGHRDIDIRFRSVSVSQGPRVDRTVVQWPEKFVLRDEAVV